MFPFLLYFAAGATTALHVCLLFSLSAVGGTPGILKFVSLAGSAGLIVSSFGSLFRPYPAAKLALPASLTCWCFYAPAFLASVRTGPHAMSDIQVAVFSYSAVAFLLMATVYSVIVSFKPSSRSDDTGWFLPSHANRPARITVLIALLVAVIAAAAWFSFGAHSILRRPARFWIPEGYVGWVTVEFEIPNAPPLPIEDGRYVFRIPASGDLKTSSSEQLAAGKREYSYVSERGLAVIPSSTSGPDCMIWGKISGEGRGVSGSRKYEEFFVGTEQQFKEKAGETHPPPH
jgi:hypothetical protein